MRNPSLHVTMAVVMLACLGALWFHRAGGSGEEERLQSLTYEEARPYLEARYTVREGRIWLCTATNFARLENDPLLERLSREAAEAQMAGGQKLTPLVDTSAYGNGDSPWGSFRKPQAKALMSPAFEAARRSLLAEMPREKRHE